MQFYSPGDDLYFFGFSRGAYTARFLAEMLDYVGLLTPGQYELVRDAWKVFSKWQQRRQDKGNKLAMFEFMKAFRETFSRPVRRIRFLGLFDTVNSVPRFEAAWMQRSKHPYTARSSAKVIRHAVGIDERRAKFRQDLVSGHTHILPHHLLHDHHPFHQSRYTGAPLVKEKRPSADETANGQGRRPSEVPERARQMSLAPEESGVYRARSKSPASRSAVSGQDAESQLSVPPHEALAYDSEDELELDQGQSIEEVWFPGMFLTGT